VVARRSISYPCQVVEEAFLQCSSKGCRAAARWQLRWNNPKLHAPDHRKTWLACDDHRESLGGFLEIRGFLREVQSFSAPSDGPGAGGSTAPASGHGPPFSPSSPRLEE
jgi:hypothetical protein